MAEEPVPEETTSDDLDLPPPPTPPQAKGPATPPVPKRQLEDEKGNGSGNDDEKGNGTLSRQSWVPNLDSPRSSASLGTIQNFFFISLS